MGIEGSRTKSKPIPLDLVASHKERFWSKVDVGGKGECWEWRAGVGPNGYGRFKIGARLFRSHRIALALSTGDGLGGYFACHHCDNPRCCNPSHLYAGTAKTNVADMVQRGRHGGNKLNRGGENNPFAKLTEDLVRSIRKDKRTRSEIARDYGIAPSTVKAVKCRYFWKDVEDA